MMKYDKLVFIMALFVTPLRILSDPLSIGLTLSYRNEIVTMDFQCNNFIIPISIIYQSPAKNPGLDAFIKKIEKQTIASQKRESEHLNRALHAIQLLNKNDSKYTIIKDNLKRLEDHYDQ